MPSNREKAPIPKKGVDLDYIRKTYSTLEGMGIVDIFERIRQLNPSASINELERYRLSVTYKETLGKGKENQFRLSAIDFHQNVFLYNGLSFYDLPTGRISMLTRTGSNTKTEAEVEIARVLTQGNFFAEFNGHDLFSNFQGLLALRGISPYSQSIEENLQALELVYQARLKNFIGDGYAKQELAGLKKSVEEIIKSLPKQEPPRPAPAEIIDKKETATDPLLKSDGTYPSLKEIMDGRKKELAEADASKTPKPKVVEPKISVTENARRFLARLDAEEAANPKPPQTVTHEDRAQKDRSERPPHIIDAKTRELYDSLQIPALIGSMNKDIFKGKGEILHAEMEKDRIVQASHLKLRTALVVWYKDVNVKTREIRESVGDPKYRFGRGGSWTESDRSRHVATINDGVEEISAGYGIFIGVDDYPDELKLTMYWGSSALGRTIRKNSIFIPTKDFTELGLQKLKEWSESFKTDPRGEKYFLNLPNLVAADRRNILEEKGKFYNGIVRSD